MDTSFGVILLCGGTSQRMGRPKAFLDIEETTFIEKICDTYCRSGVKPICIVMNKELVGQAAALKFPPHVKILINNQTELGRFHSLKLGANYFKHQSYCFIQNIDNPFTCETLIAEMMRNKPSDGYLVPVYKGEGGHPVLITQNIIKEILNELERDLNFRKILNRFQRHELVVDQKNILANINTPEDYMNYISKGSPILN